MKQTTTIRYPRMLMAWIVVIAIGFTILMDYQFQAGHSGLPVQQFPSDSGISVRIDGPTLIMFVHPRCPCSRASIEEFAKIMARSSRSINSHVVFFRPNGADDNWSKTDLWQSAERIPNLQILVDVDGRLTKTFGARTSGHIFYYDELGFLRYQGGITPSRGHIGDNHGKAAIFSLLRKDRPAHDATPVFGCPLCQPS